MLLLCLGDFVRLLKYLNESSIAQADIKLPM